MSNQALTKHEPQALAQPLSPEAMAHAVSQYQGIQAVLDQAMPDALMTIQGRKFRKKAYWRAVAVAFSLQVECREEHRSKATSGDWGWTATYRATTPGGRYADGDGTCMASEKTGKGQATEHNVRSHAHTRAYNRAVSNLVGFGEVSAEEINVHEVGRHDVPTPPKSEAFVKPESGQPDDVYVLDPYSHLIIGVTTKQGEGKNGAWTKYAVVFNDDVTASTFDAKVGELAQYAAEHHLPVRRSTVQKGKYTNLEQLEIIEASQPSDPPDLLGDPADDPGPDDDDDRIPF